mgnify:FL=1
MQMQPQTNDNNGNGVIEKIRSKDKDVIINLITTDNQYISRSLRIINLHVPTTEITERRQINVTFMTCLIEIEASHPSALLWLKRNIDSDICDTIMSDYDYTG